MKKVFAKIFRTVFRKILQEDRRQNYHLRKHTLFSVIIFNLCKKRLMNFYSKLKSDPELLEFYNEIFIEQKELGSFRI